jgi:hypothetical protein
MTMDARCMAGDQYMQERTGKYEWREVRYEAAARALTEMRLGDQHTVLDVGAGWTEFDFHLRVSRMWKGRYIPLDAGIDGIDLEHWWPPRTYDFAVALELLEHLEDPAILLGNLHVVVTRGIVVSVPNPRTVDVLGIDPTHKTVVTREFLESWGFYVEERTFYGGVFSNGEPDSLFGVWTP